MFARKRARPSVERVRACSIGGDAVVWAVGDVHGQDDLFNTLLSLILTDLDKVADCRRTVVLLGDYIDRGVGSAKVLQRILALRSELSDMGVQLVTLMGNHEALLLQFIDQPATGPDWMEIGGRETLLSYEVSVPSHLDASGWDRASSELLQRLPLEHLALLEELPLSHTQGDYFFVHAGVRPGTALDEQSAEDMMWIRDAFLKDTRPFDKIIVHGHTPVEDIHVDDRRICLDTGAYATGVLSAMRLQGSTQLVAQARRSRSRVRLDSRPLFGN